MGEDKGNRKGKRGSREKCWEEERKGRAEKSKEEGRNDGREE